MWGDKGIKLALGDSGRRPPASEPSLSRGSGQALTMLYISDKRQGQQYCSQVEAEALGAKGGQGGE